MDQLIGLILFAVFVIGGALGLIITILNRLERIEKEREQERERERKKRQTRQQKEIEEEIPFLVKAHRFALEKELSLEFRRDAYGTVIHDERDRVVSEFLASVHNPKTAKNTAYIDAVFECLAQEDEAFDPQSAPIDGHDFEHWVARNLKQFGWDTQVTQGSGDQGIDVIAKMNGISVGVQCKRDSGQTGNKAVQEAIAGMRFHGTDKAVVISTGRYTKSAQELAKVSDITLLSEYDLPNMQRKLGL